MADDAIPLLRDVTFRITEAGDYVGLDLVGSDGVTRSSVVPAVLVSKMLAGFLWSAEEAGRRGALMALSDSAIGHLQSSSPTVTGYDIVGGPGGPVIDFQIGPAHACLRLTREAARALADALLTYLGPRETP